MALVALWGPSAAVVKTDRCLCPLGPEPGLAAVTYTLWAALILGACGTAAGLVALRRGRPPAVRWLVGGGLLAAVALAVLPSVATTDMLSYAAYGRMASLGHSPYTMTPLELRELGDPIGLLTAEQWQNASSVYGPVATLTQWAAAELGGTSMAATHGWLKLWNVLAFVLGAVALDRLAGGDLRLRTRVHLLWTGNPLLLWHLIAGGHIDALAAGLMLAGLWAHRTAVRAGASAWGAAGAGVLFGAMVGIKAPFALIAFGVAWSARRSPRLLAIGIAGAAAVLVPGYALTGVEAISVMVKRGGRPSGVSPWRVTENVTGWTLPTWLPSAAMVCLTLAGAVVLLRTLPQDRPEIPALRGALALALAWSVATPVYFPWYEAMPLALLALWPASRLDRLMIVRLAVISVAALPGLTADFVPEGALLAVGALAVFVAPITLLVTGIAIVVRHRGPVGEPRGRDPEPGSVGHAVRHPGQIAAQFGRPAFWKLAVRALTLVVLVLIVTRRFVFWTPDALFMLLLALFAAVACAVTPRLYAYGRRRLLARRVPVPAETTPPPPAERAASSG